MGATLMSSLSQPANTHRLNVKFSVFFSVWGTLVGLCLLLASGAEGRLRSGDVVPASMNKAWPYYNPFETYSYYSVVPLCKPPEIRFESMSFGQLLRGDRLVNSIYRIVYMLPMLREEVCTLTLQPATIALLRAQMAQMYMYEIYVDDLPMVEPLGLRTVDQGETRYFIPTHHHFRLGYNDGHVVSANITFEEGLVELPAYPVENLTLSFYYSVSWNPDPTPVQSRLYRQVVGAFSTQTQGLDIHWLAIANSFIFVLLIASVLGFIVLRVVRTDLAHYLRIPDEELAAGDDECGWKLVHGDVFRAPPHRMWLCACVGSGAQLFLVAFVAALVGSISPYVQRGAILSTLIFGYLLTSCVAGYISANLYRRLGGRQWQWNVLVTVVMFMGPFLVVWFALQMVAVSYESTSALPFSLTTKVVLCWLFAGGGLSSLRSLGQALERGGIWIVTFPLTVVGAVLGRYRAAVAASSKKIFPCTTNRLAREIPLVPWYQSPWLHVLMAGFLPFGAIYVELHYVFMSLWGPNVYTLYGILICAFIIHLLVAAAVSVLLTYVHLNAEDYKWWWRAFLSGGSVALYFFAHCIYYFVANTRMTGALQYTFFFGYSAMVAWAVFLIVGFITFSCNYGFIKYIYSNIKSD